MKQVFKEFLFTKSVLVSDGATDHAAEVLYSLARLFNIRITEGAELATSGMVSDAEAYLGQYVPESFYRNFPDSVRLLSSEALYFDQALHYLITYGRGDFSQPGHSVLEAEIEREVFREITPIKEFRILSEAQAQDELVGILFDMMKSPRPLNTLQFCTLLEAVRQGVFAVEQCACLDTVINLVVELRDPSYARFLSLADVMKVVALLHYQKHQSVDLCALRFSTADRRFIENIIYAVFASGRYNVADCFEKKALWSGLLHHIHFRPKTEQMREFAALMRGRENRSVYAAFERAMGEGDIQTAVEVLLAGKGSGALLRRLNYIISRCSTPEQVRFVVDHLQTDNAVVLLQLYLQYCQYNGREGRTFGFRRFHMSSFHIETEEEMKRRRSVLSEGQVKMLSTAVLERLSALLHGRLGKVYIEADMENITVPLNESAAQSGYGVLPVGSRVPLPEGKKLRAFTYWERARDIDLSCMGLCDDGTQIEFSWRYMSARSSEGVLFSGDQTSGYEGGSEYFDITLAKFKKKYPRVHYLVFSDNVYSDEMFSECLCKAGFMFRDDEDSGEVFEPKTVRTSFTVTAESHYAYLYALDLVNREMIWLNMARDSDRRVAGVESFAFLRPTLELSRHLNLAMLFSMLATEVVTDPAAADVILSDKDYALGEEQKQIHSFDFEAVLALLGKVK